MNPELDNGGRWHHIMSDAEVSIAMRRHDVEVIEVPVIQATFIMCRSRGTILRTGALGGDTVNVVGGWQYANDIAWQLDRHELVTLRENTAVSPR